jgi:3-dehydroquinate dehydratase/shikimate dehydrogenase
MKICQTIAVSTLKALRAERDAVRPGGPVSLVELRLDHLEPGELDVAGALEGRSLPVIVTCRPARQGGKFEGPEDTRLRVLREAARLGAEFVDVEFDAALTLTPAGTRTVLSDHDFTPGIRPDLADRVRAMRSRACASSAAGNAIVKVAITAERPGDCATLRRILFDTGDAAPGTIGIAMGAPGALSRMLPAKFSGEWTYAGAAAPGQFSVDDMAGKFRAHEVSAATRVFGIAGNPLSHSASPAMHNAAFKHAGIDAVFVPVETPDVSELRELADSIGIEGLSVTAPLKSAVMAFAAADSESRSIGAVNTLKRTGGIWEARNFDAPAFMEPLKEELRALRGLRAIVLGAGGAARAAARELTRAGCKVEVSARDAEKAAALAAEFGAAATSFPPHGSAALIVNATSAGTKGSASPIPARAVTATIAYDLVYNPQNTAFLSDARAAGARTIGGLAMLVAQARRQFEWWTGVSVPPEVFEQAAREFIR